MLTAINQANQEKIFIGDWQGRIEQLRELLLVDPIFGKPVYPRKGHMRKNFFVRSHFVGQAVYEDSLPEDLIIDEEYIKLNTNGTYRLGESADHLQGKIAIANWARGNLDLDWSQHRIEYEKRVSIPAKNGKYRIVDVAVVKGDEIKYALECQISPINLDSLSERSFDYVNAAIEPEWFFGRQSRTAANIDFIYREMQKNSYLLQFSDSEETQREWQSMQPNSYPPS